MRTGPDDTAGSGADGARRSGYGDGAGGITRPDALAPLRRWLSHMGALLLPGVCALCGGLAGAGQVCAPCRRHYIEEARAAPACGICANSLPAGAGAVCGHCLRKRPAFDATVAAGAYALPLDRLVLQLKFGGRVALARLFGEALADAVAATPGMVRPDVLCPVPLGPRRLAERGYNQALEMARPLARRLAVPLQARLAVRVKETAALSRTATPAERRAHVAGAFAVPRRALVEGRHVALVDDVMTSGATMDELAALFKRHGAARITCLVFARTPPPDEDVL